MLLRHVSPGFDKFIFIKNTSKTAFYGNPQTHVVAVSLFRVLKWGCSLSQNASLRLTQPHTAAKTGSVCCVCMKSNIKEQRFFF